MNQPANKVLRDTEKILKKHQLPPLKYDFGALEPYIDARTMLLHHDIHHGGYVGKLNEALEKAPDFQNASALWLLCNLDKLPKEIRGAVRHSAGGHINHSMFWRAMSLIHRLNPRDCFERPSIVTLAVSRSSRPGLKKKAPSYSGRVGSGWVWLVRTQKDDGKLEVVTTSGHDNPMMKEGPISAIAERRLGARLLPAL